MYTNNMDKAKQAFLNANIAIDLEDPIVVLPIVTEETPVKKEEVVETPAKAKKTKPTSETVENEDRENSN